MAHSLQDHPRRLLVVGARPYSIGSAVVEQATLRGGWDDIVTAGVSGEEKLVLDLDDPSQCQTFFEEFGPFHAVVCTAGINLQGGITHPDICGQMVDSSAVNWIGHVYLLSNWMRYWFEYGLAGSRADKLPFGYLPLHWASISSNSASIARSKSLAYCASKAALSASIRCAARDAGYEPVSIYCYEPGWVDHTPMSNEVERRLSAGKMEPPQLHRIPGGAPIGPLDLADLIVYNLKSGGKMLNGCCLRTDGGEQ